MTRTFLSLFVFAGLAASQSITGTIQGVVEDPTGARVPGSRVTATRVQTNLQRLAATDGEGRYAFPNLMVGEYEVSIERAGFARATQRVRLSVNQEIDLNFALTLQGSESVEVRDRAPVLDVSGLVDQRRVRDLPLNGRNFSQLINLQPGVAVISSHGLLGGGPDAAGIQGSGMYVNGARGSNNSFLFDGGDANDPVVPGGTGASSTAAFTGGAPGINAISVDAIEEFRVITSGASAEFGRSSGAVINVITKSGTNQWHGSMLHFLRNRALNARNTYEAAKPGFTQNNFGGTVGGKIRRDRTFFFASYEGFRQRQAVTVPNVIPSPNTIAAVKQQNALLGAIFEGYYGVPALRGVAFSERTVEQILATQQPVIATVQLPRGNGIDQNALLGKIDQATWRDGRLTGRYQLFEGAGLNGSVSGTGMPGSNVGYANRSQNVVMNHTQILGAKRLNEFRAVFQRNSPRTTIESTPAAALAAGRLRTAGPFAGQPYGDAETPNGLPTISPGFGITPIGYDTTAPNRRGVNTYQVSDTFTRVAGAHTVKGGFELRRIQENSVFSFRLRPDVVFASGGVNTILQPGAPVNQLDQNVYITPATALRGFRLTEWAGFVQDNWRVSAKLSVDAGLRYEYYGRPYEVNGYLSNGFLAPEGQVRDAAPLGSNGVLGLRDLRLIRVGPGTPYAFYQADRNNIAPRLGLAYRAGLGLVVRTSYGIYYDRMFNNVFGNARVSPPFTIGAQLASQPFGAIPSVDPFTTNIQVAPVTIQPNLRSPYTQRFHASVQREVSRGTAVEIGYVGARALKLVRTLRLNQGAGFAGEFRPANIDVTARARTLDDFRPNVIGNMSTRDGSGHSTYHSLQASLQRRFTSGLSLQASYTYGRSTDLASGEILTDVVVTSISNLLPLRTSAGTIPLPSLTTVNQARQLRGEPVFSNVTDAARWFNQTMTGPEQWRADIGNSAFDIRQILVANAAYELPWAKRRWYGGWQIAAIVRMQTGVPFTLSSGVDVNGDGNLPDRAALLSGDLGSLVTPQGRRYFAADALSRVGVSRTPERVESYLKRGALHGPALRLIDFAVHKNFRISEQWKLQYRAEFFNVPNATNYGLPVNTITSPLFGQILSTATPPRQVQMGLRLEF